MIELAYRCDLPDHQHHVYTLMQYGSDEPFSYMIDGEVIGKLDKVEGSWKQLSGKDTPQEVINDIGSFLDNRKY
ncbi:hypothetical protein [Pedobacter frigidisoli]|uniref:hypothetical protein n=1 Tax=Pedobacter frigidisoli TaxID=2530455 RepID=UPI0029319748|nr:hypothetical protein [Pedobacter frigidisoli]